MKSNRQRRAEIMARRRKRAGKAARPTRDPRETRPPDDQTAPCNPALLALHYSYGPHFVLRGYYVDTPFECANCRRAETWKATQQKWWYEVAKGNVESRAMLCRNCRRAERERKAAARQVHIEGVARKLAAKLRGR